jgi:hypothetical protein
MDRNLIFIVPHYINSLRYYDKLHKPLLEESIKVIYILRSHGKMEEFCKENKRKYEILPYRIKHKFRLLFEPYSRYFFKKEVEKIISKYKPNLIIQTNDMRLYNDIIVKVAKKFKIMTMGLQWAVTALEQFYFINRDNKQLKNISTKNILSDTIKNLFYKFIEIVYLPLFILTGTYSNHKQSLAQGDSDAFGVINKYTKMLLIKQGVDFQKISVVGSLHFDDALDTIKTKSNEILRKQFKANDSDVIITYFSQPFYKKDITILNLVEQLNYVSALIDNIHDFFYSIEKSYKLIIKLHPVEDLADYTTFSNRENVVILDQANNYDLILLSDLCISQHSTTLQAAIIMKKPIISLNILKLDATNILSKVLGIKSTTDSWEMFNENLKLLESTNYSHFENINHNQIISDGECYQRTIRLIKKLIRISRSLKSNYNN